MRRLVPFCLVLVVGIAIGVNVGKKEEVVEAPAPMAMVVPPKADVAVTRVERLPMPVETPFVPLYMGAWE